MKQCVGEIHIDVMPKEREINIRHKRRGNTLAFEAIHTFIRIYIHTYMHTYIYTYI